MRRGCGVAVALACWGMLVCWAEVGWGQSAPTQHSGAYGITIGRETTYLTAPLLPDGRVDYAGAINVETSKGVTPENNAACLLARITRTGENQWWNVKEDVLAQLGVDPKAARPAWTDLHKELEKVVESREAGNRPWRQADLPELADWLESNRAAMELFAQASRRTQWWEPTRQSGEILLESGPTGLWATATAAAEAMRMRSMLKLGLGDEAGAWEDLAACERMAGLISRSPDLTGRLTAALMHRATMTAVCGMLEHGELPGQILPQMEALLRELPRWPVDGQVYPPSERYQFLMAVAHFAKGMQAAMDKEELGLREQFRAAGFTLPDWNRILRMGNGLYDLLEQDVTRMSAEARAERRRAVQVRLDKLMALRGKEDPARLRPDGTADNTWLLPRVGETQERYTDRVGATIALMLSTEFGKREALFDACTAATAWTRVGVALVRYGRDRGGYPDGLGALVPRYLERLPNTDAEHPVRYERKANGFVLTKLPYVSAATTRPERWMIAIRRER